MTFARNLYKNHGKQIIEYCCRNRTRYCKNCFQKLAHEKAEATSELMENKLAEKVVKPKTVPYGNQKNLEKILFHQTKETFIKLRPVSSNATSRNI